MRPMPDKLVVFCGAHMDQIMRLNASSIMGVSNPAKIELIAGGAALNSASIAAGLGIHTTLLSPVGDDLNGRFLVSVCSDRGINPLLIPTPGHTTGIYSAIFEPDGDILIGASDLTIYDCIDNAWIDTHLPEDCGLFLNSNLPGPQLLHVCAKADFVAAATISPAKAIRLLAILPQLDILFSNLGEARVLCGSQEFSALECAKWLIDKGVAAGTVSDGSNDLTYWQGNEVGSLPVRKTEKIADVNGAGDVLAGALLAAFSRGRDFTDAVAFAISAASHSVQFEGPYNPDLIKELRAELA